MGMAASQARLLTITARMHDVEYKAQSIQNAKIQLATQSDQVYKEYIEALDATTLTVTDMNKQTIVANFNNLFGKNAVETGKKYALRNDRGQLVVEADIKEAYDNFKENGGTDPYQFALTMLFGDDSNALSDGELENQEFGIFAQHYSDKSNQSKDEMKAIDDLLSKHGHSIGAGAADKDFFDKYTDAYNAFMDDESISDEDKDKLVELEEAFKASLYKTYASEIFLSCAKFNGEELTEDDFNRDDFNYYVSIFKQIELAGGCESIAEYNGFAGDASSDSDWLQNQIQCGKFTIEMVNEDKKGVVSFASTSPSSDSNISYTTTSTIDKSALAKAEAKYEHDSKDIDQKDKKFDLELSKLETERNALDTEYKSVQKVIQENIERTFGIFS